MHPRDIETDSVTNLLPNTLRSAAKLHFVPQRANLRIREMARPGGIAPREWSDEGLAHDDDRQRPSYLYALELKAFGALSRRAGALCS